MVILVILILGSLSVLVGSDAGNVSPGVTPTVPQLETPLDDAGGGQGTDLESTPEMQPSDINAES
jgi:hypothetical protein